MRSVSDFNYLKFHINWNIKEMIENNRIVNNEKLFLRMQQKDHMKIQG